MVYQEVKAVYYKIYRVNYEVYPVYCYFWKELAYHEITLPPAAPRAWG